MIKKLKEYLFPTKPESNDALLLRNDSKIKVCIIDFIDNVESTSAQTLCEQLKGIDNLSVTLYKETINKSFLSLEPKHLFDFIDTGLDILYKTKADVLVWGIRESNDSIRLHFQNEHMFSSKNPTFSSILDALYIPTSNDNFSSSIINLVYGAILSSFVPQKNELNIIKKYWLKKVIATLSKDNSAKELPKEYTPYIMNFLGLIYLSYSAYEIKESDYKICSSLFENALAHQDLIKNPLHLGRIYIHLGQLNDITSSSNKVRPIKFYKNAVSNYRSAQKHINKYNYAYDYGYICYRLYSILFAIFKQKDDTQALRDSIFQLREAEKIFTQALFPDFWADIQGSLGYSLSILGAQTSSQDISELAISAYKNQQKIITERVDAINWAKIEEKIGNIYYAMSKSFSKKDLSDIALEHFHDALYIYENANLSEDIKKINIAITKSSS